MRALKILGICVGALVVLIAIVLAVGLPGGLLTDVIQNRIERQTGYRLEIDTTTISLRPSPTFVLSKIALSDPRNGDTGIQLSVDELKAQLSLASLLRGKPHIDELTIIRPVLHAPMHRERVRRQDGSGSGASNNHSISIDLLSSVGHVVVQDGTVVLADKKRNVENRINKIGIDLNVSPGRKAEATLAAEAGGQPLTLDVDAIIPEGSLSGLTVPVNFVFKAPGILREQMSAAAQVRLDGSTVLVDSLKGLFDGAAFNGSASFDLDSKPLIKVSLDFERLGLKRPGVKTVTNDSAAATATPEPVVLKPWDDKPFDLRGLNYLDAQIHLAIGTLALDKVQIAPVEIDANLADGIVRGTLSKMGVYEGQAAAGLAMDASSDTPSFALRSELRQVRALPLLSNAADFTSLDGKLDATINVQTVGRSLRELIANLSGMTVANFQNGEIRGINVAKMIRALTAGTLSGWQDGQTETTDLTELSASFRVDKGQAMTQDLKLAGPLVRVAGIGTVDINTKAMNFRVEPKLVMSLQGQGGTTDPVGLGIPVMIQGPWNKPRIFPDMAGILDNPDDAYAKLRQLGQGLFGPNFLQPSPSTSNAAPNAANPAAGGDSLINNIGALIKGVTGPKSNQGSGQAAPAGAAGQGSGGPAGQPATGSNADQQPASGNSNQAGSAAPQTQVDQLLNKLLGR